jgi:Choline dehydrogenase and related flavoproteins
MLWEAVLWVKTQLNRWLNSKGRHHEVENLSIFDGSVFPTSIAANPMESIFAVTAKFATELAKVLVM